MIPAEARGKLRLWKSQASRRWESLEELFTSDAVHAIARDFSLRGSRLGQERALKKLRRVFDPLAQIRVARLGAEPKMLWAVPVSRSPVIVGSDDPSERQAGAAIYFILAGRTGRNASAIDTGLWAFEVSDHALGRVLQRGGPGVTSTRCCSTRTIASCATGCTSGRMARNLLSRRGPGFFVPLGLSGRARRQDGRLVS